MHLLITPKGKGKRKIDELVEEKEKEGVVDKKREKIEKLYMQWYDSLGFEREEEPLVVNNPVGGVNDKDKVVGEKIGDAGGGNVAGEAVDEAVGEKKGGGKELVDEAVGEKEGDGVEVENRVVEYGSNNEEGDGVEVENKVFKCGSNNEEGGGKDKGGELCEVMDSSRAWIREAEVSHWIEVSEGKERTRALEAEATRLKTEFEEARKAKKEADNAGGAAFQTGFCLACYQVQKKNPDMSLDFLDYNDEPSEDESVWLRFELMMPSLSALIPEISTSSGGADDVEMEEEEASD